jgi:uncharacterized protein (TIGR03435 family)
MLRAVAGLSLILLLPGLSPGQSNGKEPAFEVADVHVTPPGGITNDDGFMPGGRYEKRGATMVDLISDAYGVDEKMVVGGPGWLASDRFDIIAKSPGNVASEEVLQSMLKSLLADRFQLVVHKDKKDMPVFVLTVAKKGPKLPAAAKEGPPNATRGTGDPALNIHWVLGSYTMEALAQFLPQAANNFVTHPVVDETNLKGAYDFHLDWMGRNIYNAAKANPDGPKAVSPFDALEAIGLKLDPGTHPMPVLVVDKVNETPTPNAPNVVSKIPSFPTEFDVAEVRPAKPGAAEAAMTKAMGGGVPAKLGPLGFLDFQNGRIQMLGATLRGLVTFAYNVDDRWIVGAPKWMAEDRFDIIAKGPPTVTEEAVRVMLKNLLVERFKLAAHSEDQPMPVFVLLAGKSPKLKQSDGTARSECNIVNTDRRNYVCTNTTMAQFGERLPTRAAAYVHPPVLDLTGLKGAYDFQLYWTPRNVLSRGGGNTGGATAEAVAPTGDVTLFEAVDKQLGLKLEEQKHPVPVLVIDKADRTPREN